MKYALTNLIQSIPDERDLLYVPLTGTISDETDLGAWETAVESQGAIGSCTAQATNEACEMLTKRAGNTIDLSPQFLYYNTRAIEGSIGQDNGAQLRNALRSAHHQGVCYEPTWPYNGNIDVEPSPAAYAEALTMKALRYERIHYWTDSSNNATTLIRGVKSALQEGLGVVLAMRLGEQFRNISGPLFEHRYFPIGPGNPWIGNHAMKVRAVRDKNYPYGLTVKNSWDMWGDEGYGLLSWPAITNDCFEIWAIRGFGDFEVVPPPGILLREMSRWYLSARIVPPVPQRANVWVGAKIGGILKLKREDESWMDYDGTFPPYRSNVDLSGGYEVVVNDGYDLAKVPNAEIIVAYGSAPLIWTLAKVCDVPMEF